MLAFFTARSKPAAVPDRDSELLLERRPHVEPGVVVGPEEARLAQMPEPGGELTGGLDQVAVVALAVGLEPVAVVVRLEVAQELECFGGPHVAEAYGEVSINEIGYRPGMETSETPQPPPDEKPPPEVPDQPGTSPGEPGEPSEPSE